VPQMKIKGRGRGGKTMGREGGNDWGTSDEDGTVEKEMSGALKNHAINGKQDSKGSKYRVVPKATHS